MGSVSDRLFLASRGNKVSYVADWFSLGVIIYELVTGELPYSTKWNNEKEYKYELQFPQNNKMSAQC